MENLNFNREELDALYRIFVGLSSSCYQNAEVYDEAKPNMEKVYKKVLNWGSENCKDLRGEKMKDN